MNILHAPLELKKLSDEGTFEGLASPYGGKPDLGGDIVEAGSFKEFELTRDGQIRILDGHDTRQPIGKGILSDTPVGLAIKGTLNLAVSRAREVLALMKDGILDGLSIGYDVLPGGAEYRDGARHLMRLKLYEVSPVLWPMNPAARIAEVKDASAAASLRELEHLLSTGTRVELSSRKAKAGARELWRLMHGTDAEDEAPATPTAPSASVYQALQLELAQHVALTGAEAKAVVGKIWPLIARDFQFQWRNSAERRTDTDSKALASVRDFAAGLESLNSLLKGNMQ